MLSMALLFVVVAMGSLMTGITGLGGGTLILAGLMMIYPPEIAIPLHSFTQLSANGIRTVFFHRQIDWPVVASYGILMLPASWLAASIFDHINPAVLKILVGLLILSSVIPWRLKPRGIPNLKTFTMLGAASGFLGVFVGAVGPAVVPFFNRLNISRDGILSTKSAGQMLLQISKILAFTGAAGFNFLGLKDNIMILVVATLVGVGLSVPIGKKISDKKFNRAVNILLLLISLKVIVEGLKQII